MKGQLPEQSFTVTEIPICTSCARNAIALNTLWKSTPKSVRKDLVFRAVTRDMSRCMRNARCEMPVTDKWPEGIKRRGTSE
jgi:hypothetical protein